MSFGDGKPPGFSDATPRSGDAPIGRDQDLDALLRLTRRHPAVTLVGAPGIGKSTVAQAALKELRRNDPDGARRVALATARDLHDVLDGVGATLGLGGATLRIDDVANRTRGRRMFLLLDDCENVAAEAAALADAVARSGETHILATSRRVLGAAGETMMKLGPLVVPPAEDALAPDAAARYPAVRLFLERGRDALGHVDLDARAAASVRRICRRLGGVPLAIEWAATHLRLYSVERLDARIHQHFRKAEAAGARLVEPLAILEALFAWSYDLATGDEKRIYHDYGFVSAGWRIDLVGPDGGDIARAAVALLKRLSERLSERSVDAAKTQAMDAAPHRTSTGGPFDEVDGLTAFVEEAERSWNLTPTLIWRERYAWRLNDVRNALGRAFGPGGDPRRGVRLVAYCWTFWWDLSLLAEGRRWAEIALSHVDDQTPIPVAARLWLSRGCDDMQAGNGSSLEFAKRAEALFRRTDDRMGLAMALWSQAAGLMRADTAGEAMRLARTARAMLDGVSCKLLCMCLNLEAIAHHVSGDLKEAKALYLAVADMADRIGDALAATGAAANLAEMEFADGGVEDAIRRLGKALKLCAALDVPGIEAQVLSNYAGYLLAAERFGEGLDAAVKAVERAHELGLTAAFLSACEHAAYALAASGRHRLAARFAGFVEIQTAAHDFERGPTEIASRRGVLQAIADALPAAEARMLMGEGESWTKDRAWAEIRGALVVVQE